MTHGAAGVDDVGHITLAFRGLGTNQRLARARENLGGVLLVQENGADRILPDRTNPVNQQQPTIVQLDGRATIADLNELPRILGLKDGSTAIP